MSTTEPGRRRRPRASTIVVGALLTVGALVTAFPFLWMVFASVKPRSESVAYPPHLVPSEPTLEFFAQLFNELDFGRYLVNTLAIVAICMVGLLLMAAAGYGFAKFSFPGRDALFFLVLATMMIPGQVTLVPLYLMIAELRLVDTFLGVLMPGLADVIGIFLLKQYIQTLPSELEEAARIDGASEWQAFTRIIVPLAAPAMAVTAIFAFQRYWNAFLWPLVILQSPDKFTLQVGLSYIYNSEFGTNYGLLMSGAALASIPMILFFFAFQNRIFHFFK